MKLVQSVIGRELATFEQQFGKAVRGSNPLLDRILRFIIRRKGKQMRPMFVLLSAKIAGGINDSSYHAASLIELLHTATLVHDDVVDDAATRRSFFSVNALWKNKIAVLVGDFLLAKGLLLAVDNTEFELLRITTRAVKEMSEGELLQIEKARRLDISEGVYFDIIRAKTASLLASACAAGAYSATRDTGTAEAFRLFGEKVGIAFQIKDDLFDYGREAVGKPTGNDIKEKKMTLPLIYTLQHADKATRRRIIYTVKNNNNDRDKVAEVIQAVQASGGIQYAGQKMQEYITDALSLLHTFPDTPERRALEDLVDYAVSRRH